MNLIFFKKARLVGHLMQYVKCMRSQKKWKSEQSFKSRRKMRALNLRELDDRKKSAEY